MLSFEAVKDPVGKKDTISFKIMDTETGEVVEMSADARNVKHDKRQPTWAETSAASKVLNKDVGERISKEQFNKANAERDSYREKMLSAQQQLDSKKKIIDNLEAEIATLKDGTLNDAAKLIIGAALDRYIEELAANEQLDSYDLAKKIYKHMTGMSWVTGEEDDGDDDEEDERSSDLPQVIPVKNTR